MLASGSYQGGTATGLLKAPCKTPHQPSSRAARITRLRSPQGAPERARMDVCRRVSAHQMTTAMHGL